jgi:hypothetical protein
VTVTRYGLWSLRFQATVVGFSLQHFQNVQFNVEEVSVEIHRLTAHLRAELLHLNDLYLIYVESLWEKALSLILLTFDGSSSNKIVPQICRAADC